MYNQIGELESKRNFLIQKLKGLSIDELERKPVADKWCILEIIAHLVLSEELSVGYALNKVSNPEKLQSVKFSSSIKAKLLEYVLKLNIKYKAPKIAKPTNIEELKFDDLIERWAQARQGLEQISEFPSELLKKGVLKHPYTGFMNFDQMLSFIEEHYNHHLKQINILYPSTD